MATLTTTAKLLTYNPKSFPKLDEGTARFINEEFSKIQNSIAKICEVMKAMEARMNTNGLT